MPDDYRVERALFVLGEGNSGKSYQIRHMFEDVRFGRNGVALPKRISRAPLIRLSNERMLYMRITSPQEARFETVADFYRKIDDFIRTHGPDARWNIVCPMQPTSRRKGMFGGLKLIQAFINRYQPERVRVALLNPPKESPSLTISGLRTMIDNIRKLNGADIIETMQVDARRKNGLLLPDFFDFT